MMKKTIMVNESLDKFEDIKMMFWTVVFILNDLPLLLLQVLCYYLFILSMHAYFCKMAYKLNIVLCNL